MSIICNRGQAKTQLAAYLVRAAYNLLTMAKLTEASVWAKGPDLTHAQRTDS